MKILDEYLLYLTLCEREWSSPTDNPDSFDVKKFQDVLGKKAGLGVFKQMRHSLQPSMYDLYIKNALGDYMGRPDSMNAQTMRHMGFKQFQQDLELLKKRLKFAQKIKKKIPSNFFKPTSRHGESNDPTDIGDDGGDSGDGGDGGDGGGDGGMG